MQNRTRELRHLIYLNAVRRPYFPNAGRGQHVYSPDSVANDVIMRIGGWRYGDRRQAWVASAVGASRAG